YWLGEIYLLDNDLNEAVSSFEAVVSQYPAHRKAQDARFKLGKSYHLKGDAENAVRYLTQAADGSGSSADLARQYLADNF
ncbi:MAG: tetratricopeptide repeat protein, partial [bacterium]